MNEQVDRRTLLHNRRGVIMGVANDHSIAWGIAESLAGAGARLSFTYHGESIGKRVRPLAERVGAEHVVPCDVEKDSDIERAFARIAGKIDFVVHAIAWSDRRELEGPYVQTSRENFRRSLSISCYSFTSVARAACAFMPNGGSLLTLTYIGSERVAPCYNVMGVSKAALEASIRYLAADLGPSHIRVNGISSGPMRTLAGSAIGSARYVYNWTRETSLLRRNITLQDLGGAGLYLCSDLSSGVTGEILYVDAGFHTVAIPKPR